MRALKTFYDIAKLVTQAKQREAKAKLPESRGFKTALRERASAYRVYARNMLANVRK